MWIATRPLDRREAPSRPGGKCPEPSPRRKLHRPAWNTRAETLCVDTDRAVVRMPHDSGSRRDRCGYLRPLWDRQSLEYFSFETPEQAAMFQKRPQRFETSEGRDGSQLTP